MEYQDKLTIVLPLLNREELTVRYLRYLESINFPFHVLIADGGKDEQLQQLLENKSIAPTLSYTYVRFPRDVQLLDYYKKLHNAVAMVKTPYVMLHDNDDFPMVSGIETCLDFLENNKAYVGASGKIGGFSIIEKGASCSLFFHEESYDGAIIESFEQDTALERIQYQLTRNRAVGLYYGMYKTEKVKEILQDLELLNFNDLRLNEAYFIQGLMAFGKIKFFDSYTYFRQRGTSVGTTLLKPWCRDLFFDAWMEQFERYLDMLSKKVALSTKDKSLEFVKEDLKKFFLTYLLKKPFFEKHRWQKIRDFQCYFNVLKKGLMKFSFMQKKYAFWAKKNFLRTVSLQAPEIEKFDAFLINHSRRKNAL